MTKQAKHEWEQRATLKSEREAQTVVVQLNAAIPEYLYRYKFTDDLGCYIIERRPLR